MSISEWIRQADAEEEARTQAQARAVAQLEALALEQTVTVLQMAGLQELAPLLRKAEGHNILGGPYSRLPDPLAAFEKRHWRLDTTGLGIAPLSVAWVKHWGVYLCLPMGPHDRHLGGDAVKISELSVRSPDGALEQAPALCPDYREKLARLLQARRDEHQARLAEGRRKRIQELKDRLEHASTWTLEASEAALAELAALDPDNASGYGERHAAAVRRADETAERKRKEEEARAREARLLVEYRDQVAAWLQRARGIQARNLARTLDTRGRLGSLTWQGWKLTYAIPDHGEPDGCLQYHTESAYVQRPDPDEDGFHRVENWPTWKHELARIWEPCWKPVRYTHPVSVEPVQVDCADVGMAVCHQRAVLPYTPDSDRRLIQRWADSLEEIPPMPEAPQGLRGYDAQCVQGAAWRALDEAHADLPEETI